MEIEQGFAPVTDGEMYYEVAGSGDPVVFIHGFSLDTRMWDAQFEVFAQRYRAVRYDLRGFGQSPPPRGPYSRVEDFRALLAHLGLNRPHIVGLSLGGGVSLDIALTHPDLPRSLVLVDSALGGFEYRDDYDTRARQEGLAAAKERWLAHPLFGPAHRNPAAAAALRHMVSDYSGWHWFNRETIHTPNPLPYHRLGEIRAPTLVVAGELETPDFAAIAEALANGIPGARKVVLPGVGHLSNMEAPEAFNDVVLGFLGKAGVTGAGLTCPPPQSR